MFVEIIEISSFFLGAFGAIFIIYGGIRAIIGTFFLELSIRPLRYTDIRRDFTFKIVFGLEFFIAADVLATLIAPTTDEILLLGAVVLIRVILGYFLSKESKEFQVD